MLRISVCREYYEHVIHGCLVLPAVLEEENYSLFKFWFEDRIHDGLYYRHELFYRLQTLSVEFRAQLYHSACQLAQQEPVVVTVTSDTCSLWVSLQNPNDMMIKRRNQMAQQLAHLQIHR
ncbi:MAG: hypothetical protein AAGA75_22175 [Cyanobacteria bacterium P01_E01_bin.6]